MSEPLLKAILNLFIIVVKEDDITESERSKVIEFLNQHLNSKNVENYVKFFDDKGKEALAKDQDDDENIIQELCKHINVELTKKQKTVLIKELIELILADGSISEKENQLVNSIAKLIHVDDQLVETLQQFVSARTPVDITIKDVVVLSGEEQTKDLPDNIIQHQIDGLSGRLTFIHTEDCDTYFVRYRGTKELNLNNIPLPPEQIVVFAPGSSIRGLKVSPIYYSDIVSHFLKTRKKTNISFEARNISYQFPNGNLGLRNVTITENSGKMVGLMGASGAGKSTLLNVLNGTEKPSEGEILINGFNIHTNKDRVKGVIGYVPQDDLLIEDLTVYQNLYFAAKLCFKDLEDKAIDDLVKKTLQNLGLFESKDLRVGSPLEKTISGGQRKRLNIGLELLREPAVLFADEPTSGLSSRDSENIMDLLKEISLKGKLIFVVIHQPSSDIFKMFDKLVILDVGGYQIYYGNPVEAVVYFKEIINTLNKTESACIECGNVNPEQIFNIIETKVVNEYGVQTKTRKILPEEWNKHFKEGNQPENIEAVSSSPPSSLRIPKLFSQFNVFFIRDLLSKIGNRQYVLINLIEAPLLAFLLAFIIRYYPVEQGMEKGYLFAENVNLPSYMFMSIIVSLFMGLTVSAEEIIKDRKILKREAFLNLSKGSYLSSKLVLLFSLTAFQSYLFVLVGNFILDINGMFMVYWLILFSCGCFANLLGLNISSSFNSAVTIYIMIPILLIPQLLLSGVVVKFDKLNPQITNEATVPLVGDLMASRWGLEALMVTQFKENRYERVFFDVDKKVADSEYKRLYYLPMLYSKLDFCNGQFNKNNITNNEQVEYDMEVLRNEIAKELKIVGQDKFTQLDKLVPEAFNTQVYSTTRQFLDALRKYYTAIYTEGIKERDNIFRALNETPEKTKEFEKLRDENQNETVAALVRNITEPRRIVERNGVIVRKANPIFMTPENPAHALDFRAPFYVAEKYFMGTYISTLTFNLGMIWIMTIILYGTLYFDVLRKIIYGKK